MLRVETVRYRETPLKTGKKGIKNGKYGKHKSGKCS